VTSRAKFWLTFLFFVLAAVVAMGLSGLTWQDVKHMGTPRNVLEIGGENVEVPLPPSSDGRVHPEVSPSTSGSYSFMFTDDQGQPVRWDPCRPISYVINPEGEPVGGNDLIFAAVERVSDATGLAFEYEGTTAETPSFDRPLVQEGLYGDRFAPLMFGWSTGDADSELVGSVTGLGGSVSVPGAYGDQRYLVGGVVLLDAPDVARIVASSYGSDLAIAVIMHELGHVVGLGHVDDAAELMNATNSSVTTWGPGDLEGLAIVGAGPCQES
jgi:hypothetical protein